MLQPLYASHTCAQYDHCSSVRQVYRARHKQTGELFAVKRVVRKLRNKADRERCNTTPCHA